MRDIIDRLRYRLAAGGPGTPCIIGYSDSGVTLQQDVQEATDEIERLRADLANMYRLRRECVASADALADVVKEAIHMVSVGSTLYGFDNREAWLAKAHLVFASYLEARA